MAGYRLQDARRTVYFETANGVIEAYVFRIERLTALGITRTDFEICAYDFLTHQVLTNFDGVLGLDFLNGYNICIDFRESTITLN